MAPPLTTNTPLKPIDSWIGHWTVPFDVHEHTHIQTRMMHVDNGGKQHNSTYSSAADKISAHLKIWYGKHIQYFFHRVAVIACVSEVALHPDGSQGCQVSSSTLFQIYV